MKNEISLSYFDKYQDIFDKYVDDFGEGETKACQLVTAISNLIYRYYNDGDIYDDYVFTSFSDEVVSYANWLYKYYPSSSAILDRINHFDNKCEYTTILKALADKYLNDEFLEDENKKKPKGTIYSCSGPYKVEDNEGEMEDDDEDEYY